MYQLTGKVKSGSVRHEGDTLYFSVQDRAGEASVPLSYTGTVPDPFREGREVIVNVEKQGDSYVGERNSLITKCPSKYTVTPSKTKTY
jgi:cytochrome c-type biogenesis protein CcmE